MFDNQKSITEKDIVNFLTDRLNLSCDSVSDGSKHIVTIKLNISVKDPYYHYWDDKEISTVKFEIPISEE